MSGGGASGIYQTDGRATNPLVILDSDSRPAVLADCVDLDPNGTRTLFVADQSAGEASALRSWILNITSVPEPSTAALPCRWRNF